MPSRPASLSREDRLPPPRGGESGAPAAAAPRPGARTLLAEAWAEAAGEGRARGEALQAHAARVRTLVLAAPGRAALLIGRLAADGPAEDVLAVRRFALGWAADEQAATRDAGADADAAFEAAAAALVRGLAPPAAERPRRLHSRLWTLLSVARESADIIYSRAAGLPELDRRILVLLDATGAHVLKDVTRLLGVDKAQVSRSVKRLDELGLTERGTVRQPLALTAAGRALTGRLRRMFEVRSREAALGLDAEALATFFSVLDRVTAHAIALFDEERGLSPPGERARDPDHPMERGRLAQPHRPEAIVAGLITLQSYLQRTNALAYKRLTGLSNFEARVMTEVAREPPIEWTQLASALARDESQAARTVRRLVERGLVEHRGTPGRRQGLLAPTAEGARVFRALEAEGWRRDALLGRGVPAEQLARFHAALDRMTWNVQAQLVRDLAAQAADATRG